MRTNNNNKPQNPDEKKKDEKRDEKRDVKTDLEPDSTEDKPRLSTVLFDSLPGTPNGIPILTNFD